MNIIMEEELVIKCGKNSDSLETLEALCKIEAEKLLVSINEEVSVPCWTKGPGFPELIGEIHFKKAANGNMSFEFDDSESTL